MLGEHAAEKVRLFHRVSNAWEYVGGNYTFNALELRAGLELGIDARDVRRPGGWNGRVTVQFTIHDGSNEASDTVALRVAPVLTHRHLQLARQLLTVDLPGNIYQVEFIASLKA
ncbi:Arginine deiminase type-3 [Fusarium sp. LHS14.1]|nr:Arginine deiminase type-3 [Fusarium sp. LHS14.1]